MKNSDRSRLMPAVPISLLAAWLSKDLLTPILLLGRDFEARSLAIKLVLIAIYTAIYAVIILKVVPRLLDWVAADQDDKRLFWVIFLVCVWFMSAPLFERGVLPGHDLGYHLLRIQSIKEGILAGQLPVRVNPLFLNGYGYASSLFYPDLFLYIPAAFQMIGLSIAASYKLFLVLTFLLSFCSAYYCGKGITKERTAAIMIAVVYCLSQYYLQNVYKRAALGEVQAFVFLPFIVAGLYNLIFEDFKKYWLLAVGFIGLFFCHLISLLIAASVCTLICLAAVKNIIKDADKVKRILVFLLIVLGSTVGFWLPLLEQIQSDTFKFMLSSHLLKDSAVKLSVILANAYAVKGNTVSFGFTTLLLCLLWFFAIRKPNHSSQIKIINWCLAIGLLLLLAVSDAFPWQFVPRFFNIIQFPWRLYGFASIFLSVAIGGMLQVLLARESRHIGLFFLVIVMGYSAMNVIDNSTGKATDLPQDYYQNVENTFFINNGEWLPTGADSTAIPMDAPKVVDQDGRVLVYSKIGQKMVFDVGPDCKTIDVPMIFYKGYSAALLDPHSAQSIPLNISSEGVNHTIRIYCTSGMPAGTLTVAYRGTPLQHLAFFFNLVFAAAVLIVGIRLKKVVEKDNSET